MRSVKSLFSSSPRDNLSTYQTLKLIGLAALVSLAVALIPWLGLLNIPFRLLLTMVHELGHGIAALLTGGRFIRFEMFPNGAGLAYTTGGWRFVVIPAGYLGLALFGALLIMLGRSYRWSRAAMAVIGVIMIFFSLRYGLPSVFTARFLNGILTTISGLVFGSLFLWVAFKAAPGWVIFWLHLIAIQAGLTAFSDLAAVLNVSIRFFNAPANDARSMAELTFVPAPIWAALWALIALVLIGGAIWLTWLAGIEQRRE
jgi:MFS family permease